MSPVLSRPTMCVGCHIILELVKLSEESWQCPRCNRIYETKHWKIQQRRSPKEEERRQKELEKIDDGPLDSLPDPE